MAGARVQTKLDVSKNDTTDRAPSIAMAAIVGVASGNLLASFFSWGTTDTTPTASDNVNGAHTASGKVWDAGNNQGMAMFYRANTGAGSTTITYAGLTSISNFIIMGAMEISGCVTTSPADGNNIVVDSTSPYSTPTFSTTKTDFLVGFYADITGVAIGTVSGSNGFTFTAGDSSNPIAMDWKASVAPGTPTCDIAVTTDHKSIMGGMAFTEAGGGATSGPQRRPFFMRR